MNPEIFEENKVYIDETYDQIWSQFKPESKLTYEEKNKLWQEKYKGKCVNWSGKVGKIDINGERGRIFLMVKMFSSESSSVLGFDYVFIYFAKLSEYANRALELDEDKLVTFTGKLYNFNPCISLEEGEI